MTLGQPTCALFVLVLCACTKGAGLDAAKRDAATGENHGGAIVSTTGTGGERGDAGAGGRAPLADAAVAVEGRASSDAGKAGGSSGAGGGASMHATGGANAAAGSGAGGAPSDVGAGMRPYKGVANSPCAARSALNVSWYYNWEQTETEPCSDGRGGEFVPMIWGHTGSEQTAAGIASAVTSFVGHGYQNVLGFNEPDNSSQSNIPVATAISLWPSFRNSAIRVGSPGTAANASPGQAWFKDFMTRLNADSSLQADFLAVHWYGWNVGSCDAKASQLESYIKWAEGFAGNRPIWITEWGCLNQSAPDAQTVVSFYQAAVAMFAKHPRIERYSWYPWATNCGLVNKDGSLTALGTAYAAAPAYR
jgi:hypothetical protein